MAVSVGSLAGSGIAAAAASVGTVTVASLQPRPVMLASRFAGNPVPKLTVLRADSLKFSPLPIRATSSEDTSSTTSIQTEELFADLKEKWDAVENKSTVLIYGGGAVVALWLSSIIVGAINSVPLLPKIMELIGLGYTGWFVYRYLLFKSSRKELATDIEELKKKIAGTSKE
eukprot:Gb_09245 [translate_table: standard]